MGDSVPKHTGPISLTDTHPGTEHLQNPTTHHLSEPRMETLFLRDAQAACRGKFCESKPTPFFHIVRVMAAIFRARVRRAMVLQCSGLRTELQVGILHSGKYAPKELPDRQIRKAFPLLPTV